MEHRSALAAVHAEPISPRREAAERPITRAAFTSRCLVPKSVNRDLTGARTRAIRSALAGDPDVALTAMVLRSAHNAEMSGVAIAAHMRQIDDLPDLQAASADLHGHLPANESAVLD